MEILVVPRAAEYVPAEGGALPEVDPRLQVHEELTRSVIADELLDPLEVEAIRREARHLCERVLDCARGADHTVVNGRPRSHERTRPEE